MRKRILVIVSACIVVVAGSLFGYSKCYASNRVKVFGVDCKTSEYSDNAIKYLKENKAMFDMKELNNYVVYSIDESDIENRSIFKSLYDLVASVSYNPDYTISYNVNDLKSYLTEYNKSATKSSDAYISKERNEWILVPETVGNEISIETLVSSLSDTKPLKVSDFYYQPEIVVSDLQSLYDDLVKYSNWSVTYTNDESITSSTDYVSIDEYNNITLDDSFIDSAIKDVLDSYNTVGTSKDFTTTSGENIKTNGGTWGSEVDYESELAFLKDSFKAGESLQDRTPNMLRVQNDIGSTYIEVSIQDQHVWHYVDGELCCESDCVTGKCDNRHETPTGLFYICQIQNGRTLRPKGSTSGTWVNQWMRISWDGVGLHDAYWRGAFGGTIYKNNGSHGCINLPKNYAKNLFKEVYMELPVVIY